MGENYIWIHSNIFPGKGFWFYENLTGNIRDLTRFGKPDIFGNKPVQRKKNRQIIRIYRIHQLHLIPGKGFWFYENLTGNIRDLTRFGKPDIFGNKPVQRKKNRQIIRIYRIHQLHLIPGTVAPVEHHRTNQDLPLQMVTSKL